MLNCKNRMATRIPLLALAAAIALIATCKSAYAIDTNELAILRRPPRVELRNLQAIKLDAQPPISKEDEARIRELIKNLANISSPDFGFSPTMSGGAFAPIPTARQAGAMLLTDHQLKTSDDFVELVKLGPRALPFLLKALDDQTATELVLTHDNVFGGMWFANELRGNPGNDAEQKVLATVPQAGIWRRKGHHFILHRQDRGRVFCDYRPDCGPALPGCTLSADRMHRYQ